LFFLLIVYIAVFITANCAVSALAIQDLACIWPRDSEGKREVQKSHTFKIIVPVFINKILLKSVKEFRFSRKMCVKLWFYTHFARKCLIPTYSTLIL